VKADRYFTGCPVVFHVLDQGSNESFLLRCREVFPQRIEPQQRRLNFAGISHRLVGLSAFCDLL